MTTTLSVPTIRVGLWAGALEIALAVNNVASPIVTGILRVGLQFINGLWRFLRSPAVECDGWGPYVRFVAHEQEAVRCDRHAFRLAVVARKRLRSHHFAVGSHHDQTLLAGC